MKHCAWCTNTFSPNVSYQIYCSKECRDLATRQKITERYQITRRKNRAGKQKKCAGGCGTIISIYNDAGFCNSCMINKRKVDQMLKELKGMFDYDIE